MSTTQQQADQKSEQTRETSQDRVKRVREVDPVFTHVEEQV